MSGIPTWLAAAAGLQAQAGQINQFLGAHPAQMLYQGTQRDGQSTAGTGSITTTGQYLAQKFTTAAGQTAVGYASAFITPTTIHPTVTMQMSIYASSGGAPAGSPLISVTASVEYVSFAPSFVVFPLPLTGLTPSTTYFLVTAPAGPDATHCYQWNKSNQASGAYTSSNGTSWTAQAYGFQFKVFDQSVVGPLTAIWEDSGARWSWMQFTAAGLLQELSEYTAAQGGGYLQSNRVFTYSGNQLTGVA
jgi:hypothetical protein